MTSYIFAKWIKIYQIKILKKQEKKPTTKQDFCDDVLVVNSAMKKINISAAPPTVSAAAAAAAASEFLDFTNQVQWLQLLLNLEAILLLLPLYVLL